MESLLQWHYSQAHCYGPIYGSNRSYLKWFWTISVYWLLKHWYWNKVYLFKTIVKIHFWGDIPGVMDIIIGNELSETSLNSRQGSLYFTS